MEKGPAIRTVFFADCFGWLHTPASGQSSGTAVVVCAGLATDGLNAYRPFRLLANALAEAGYTTLRFDYPGTGNSGDSDAADIWQAWRSSVHSAVDWVLGHGLAARVVLCGFRAGAAIAVEVAEAREDIAGLLLLEPVLRGRSYLRQLSMEAGNRAAELGSAGPLAVHELKLSVEAVRQISRIDLRGSRPSVSNGIGVFAQAPSRLLLECIAAWREAGRVVETQGLSGLEAMLRPTLMSHVASIDAMSILTWLRKVLPFKLLDLPIEHLPAESRLQTKSFVEMPTRFGAGKNLFGVLCEPSEKVGCGLVVLITNSSGNPHYGFARFGVEFSRRLAAIGVASLRMDFAGLGDSVAPNDATTHTFETDRRDDLATAIDLLAEHGYRHFALHGLCSGAYHAFHGAIADVRVGALLLINLQHFEWNDGERVELKGYALRHPSHFLRRLGSLRVWGNLVRGRLDLIGIASVQGGRLVGELGRFGSRAVRLLRNHVEMPTSVMESMQLLSLRAKTLFLMSEDDEGVATLVREFGPSLAPPGATIQILKGIDHALSSADMREIAIDEMIRFLKSYFESEHEAPLVLAKASAG